MTSFAADPALHALANPELPAQVLSEIASARPDLWDTVLRHPSCSAELSGWIREQRAAQAPQTLGAQPQANGASPAPHPPQTPHTQPPAVQQPPITELQPVASAAAPGTRRWVPWVIAAAAAAVIAVAAIAVVPQVLNGESESSAAPQTTQPAAAESAPAASEPEAELEAGAGTAADAQLGSDAGDPQSASGLAGVTVSPSVGVDLGTSIALAGDLDAGVAFDLVQCDVQRWGSVGEHAPALAERLTGSTSPEGRCWLDLQQNPNAWVQSLMVPDTLVFSFLRTLDGTGTDVHANLGAFDGAWLSELDVEFADVDGGVYRYDDQTGGCDDLFTVAGNTVYGSDSCGSSLLPADGDAHGAFADAPEVADIVNAIASTDPFMVELAGLTDPYQTAGLMEINLQQPKYLAIAVHGDDATMRARVVLHYGAGQDAPDAEMVALAARTNITGENADATVSASAQGGMVILDVAVPITAAANPFDPPLTERFWELFEVSAAD